MAENAPQPAPPRKSLGKLLIVAALSCVSATAIALLVLPVLRRGHDRSEAYACAALRAYVQVQTVQFSAPKGGREYVSDLAMLAKAGYLDPALGQAHGPQAVPKRGYLFREPGSIAGKPIDWTKEFALCATPAKYGGATRRTFLVSTDGTVWGKDLGKSAFVADFLADPAKEGWKIAE